MFQIKYKMPICLLRWHFFKRSIHVKILAGSIQKKKKIYIYIYIYLIGVTVICLKKNGE